MKNPAISGVVNQPVAMATSDLLLISREPFTKPMPITEPTTTWVLETGTSGKAGKPMESIRFAKWCDENRNNTIAWEKTTTMAASGESDKMLLPKLCIIFSP